MARQNDIEISFISPTQFVERINCELCFISPTQFVERINCELCFITITEETVIPVNINFFGASVDPVENAKLFYQINYK